MKKQETELKKLKALLEKFYNWHVWLSSQHSPLDFVEENAIIHFFIHQDHAVLAKILDRPEKEILEAYLNGCAKLKKDGQRFYESWLINHVIRTPLYRGFILRGKRIDYYNN